MIEKAVNLKLEELQDLKDELEAKNQEYEKKKNELRKNSLVFYFNKWLRPRKFKNWEMKMNTLSSERLDLEDKIEDCQNVLHHQVDMLEQIINQGSEEVVLDKQDTDKTLKHLYYVNKENKIEDIADIALVHKTKFCPRKNKIETGMETEATTVTQMEFSGKKYDVEYMVGQNSIHFALNGPVGDHDYGSWSDCDIAIIIPFDKVDKTNLLAVAPADTYFEGGVTIPEGSVILCSESKVAELKNNVKNVQIIAYKNTALDDAIKCVLHVKGYKVKGVSNHSWYPCNSTLSETNSEARQDEKNLVNIREKYNLPGKELHWASKNAFERNMFRSFSFLLNLVKLVLEEKIIVSEKEIENIRYKLIRLRMDEAPYLPPGEWEKMIKNRSLDFIKNLLNIFQSFSLIDNETVNEIYTKELALYEHEEIDMGLGLDKDYFYKYVWILFNELNEYIKKEENKDRDVEEKNILEENRTTRLL